MIIALEKNNHIRFRLLFLLFLYTALNYSILALDTHIIRKLSHEDGIVEYLGALYFFISAILFFILYKADPNGNDLGFFRFKKNVFYLLLGLAFLFAAGEEISWGQRNFSISIPERWETINIQKEMTIHNLIFFQKSHKNAPFINFASLNTWFTGFSLVFCFFLPLLNNRFKAVSKRFQRIGLPIVPIEIGFFFYSPFCFTPHLSC